MEAATELLRQVHPSWVKEDGNVVSLAFWPFPKDAGLLSVDDGDRVTAEFSWARFVAQPNCSSAGVWSFTSAEATALSLPQQDDPIDGNPEHCVVNFRQFPEKEQKAKAKLLSQCANARGCRFRPPSGGDAPQ